MCAEKDPLHCHRTLLICRQLRDDFALRLFHILETGLLETHESTEQRLLIEMGLDTTQDEMFSDQSESKLDRAYRKRGLQIAYQDETVK